VTTLRSTLPDVFEDRQAELFFRKYRQNPQLYRRVVKYKTTTLGHDDAFKVSGLGTFVLKPEGTPISFDDPVQSQRRRVAIPTFGLGYRTTFEAEADAQYDVIDQMPSDLGDAGRDHQENLAFGVYNDAFAGAAFTGLDALALCSAVHPMLKPPVPGTTLSNLLAPGVALSITSLEAMTTNLTLTQDDNGRRIGQSLKPAVLLVHPNDEHEAARLLESEFEPNTTENQINTMRSSRTGVVPIASPFLTDTDNHFLLANPSTTGAVVWINRMSMTFDSGVDSATKDRLFDAMYRATLAVREWRGVVGSAP
jgi:hypothetical protein